MKIIAHIAIDLIKAKPPIPDLETKTLDDIADWFGDMPDCLIKARYLDGFEGVVKLEKVEDQS